MKLETKYKKNKVVGVITYNEEKARSIIGHIYDRSNKSDIECFLVGESKIKIVYKNGDIVMWVNPLNRSRCYRFTHIIIDSNIKKEEYILYIEKFGRYCKEENIKII